MRPIGRALGSSRPYRRPACMAHRQPPHGKGRMRQEPASALLQKQTFHAAEDEYRCRREDRRVSFPTHRPHGGPGERRVGRPNEVDLVPGRALGEVCGEVLVACSVGPKFSFTASASRKRSPPPSASRPSRPTRQRVLGARLHPLVDVPIRRSDVPSAGAAALVERERSAERVLDRDLLGRLCGAHDRAVHAEDHKVKLQLARSLLLNVELSKNREVIRLVNAG